MRLLELVKLKPHVSYHCTTFLRAANILHHNYFRSTQGQKFQGLSTTTDKHYFWGSREVRFVLDLTRLRKDFKCIDVAEDIHDGAGNKVNESEILILSDKAIEHANKYIELVEYTDDPNKMSSSQADVESFMKQIEPYKKKWGTEFSILKH